MVENADWLATPLHQGWIVHLIIKSGVSAQSMSGFVRNSEKDFLFSMCG